MGDLQEQEIFGNILMADSGNILSFESLKIGYLPGKRSRILLPPLSATAKRGELISVIGRNGIGKSTLLRTLTGLQPSLGGDIYYSDRNITEHSRNEIARNVGYFSTENVRVSNMKVYDLVALGRYPHTNWMGKIEDDDHIAVMDSLRKTSMESFAGKFITELSDGERQKVMIARLLAQDTPVMIMDEPTAFLDVAGKFEIFHLMSNLVKNSDKTIIFSTHDLQVSLNSSDKIWLMLDDRLLEGAPEDLALTGDLDHLFNSSSVIFNPVDGSFTFRSEKTGTIFIEGEGRYRLWTEKAVQRAGFMLSMQRTMPYISINDGDQPAWRLLTKSTEKEFSTIYELITCLRRESAI